MRLHFAADAAAVDDGVAGVRQNRLRETDSVAEWMTTAADVDDDCDGGGGYYDAAYDYEGVLRTMTARL